mgnify:CR=1 FL=1
MNARLKVEGIRSGYGEIQVLRGIEMLCGEAQITALVGSNGAGKSTLLRTLAGILPTATGRILHGEAEIQRLPSHERVARGIIMVPEGRLAVFLASCPQSVSLQYDTLVRYEWGCAPLGPPQDVTKCSS